MTKRDPSQFTIDADVPLGPVGTRGRTKRLAELDAQAAKEVLAGADLRAVAEAFAPKYAIGCFGEWSAEQREEKVRSVYKRLRDFIAGLSEEAKQAIVLS